MQKRSLSLRYKILLALTIVPIAGLSLMLTMAVDLFEKDKIAYVFDSSLSVSRTKASRVRAEIQSLTSLAQSVVLTFSRDTKSLSQTGQDFFNAEAKIDGLRLYDISTQTLAPQQIFELNKNKADPSATAADDALRIVAEADRRSVAITKVVGSKDGVWLALRFGPVEDAHRLLALVKFHSLESSDAFEAGGSVMSFLLRGESGSAFYNSAIPLKDSKLWTVPDVWKRLAAGSLPEGIEEIKAPSGQSFLVSFAQVGVNDLTVMSAVDKAAALKAVAMLLKKALIFALAILAVTVIFSVLASRSMTSALSTLLFATQRVTEGDFAVRVEAKSKDEFGDLATGFNTMAGEVARLVMETADKARMEAELATAKTVQETLFPENHAQMGPVRIAGHYTPASECGGDWWFHCEMHGKVFIWIGDATGHGAPAALLTSAARAVASVIQAGPAMSPAECISLLNRAICDTSKGKMMMTFFLASIDPLTGQMDYVNASHEPPLLVRKSDSAPSRDDYIALNEVNNPRLGEKVDCKFKQATIMLAPGDQFIMYTDGIVDVKNLEHKAWGERKFLKALSAAYGESKDTHAILDNVIETLWSYRQATPLDDDVTLIITSFGETITDVATKDSTEAA